ncbi:3'-5' exonuclease [Bacteroidales bacterium KA00344]|nr:3'-5' exonuclease [Bacteroidales bacterium KA00344]
MKKQIYSKFDKKEITALPKVTFPGRIISIITASEAEKAVDYLLSSDILGVDTETRPSFHKGEQHQVCLLQVANRDTCFLFRLHRTGITPAIKRLLEDTTVKKIGLSWHDDIRGLQAREPFTPGLFIDLQEVVPTMGVQDLSLQKLYANFFHKKISKRQRLSNWETPVLSERQKQYAAIDAWSCINLYEEFMRLKRTKDYELIEVREPEEQVQEKTEDRSENTAKAKTKKTKRRATKAKTGRKKKKTAGSV